MRTAGVMSNDPPTLKLRKRAMHAAYMLSEEMFTSGDVIPLLEEMGRAIHPLPDDPRRCQCGRVIDASA